MSTHVCTPACLSNQLWSASDRKFQFLVNVQALDALDLSSYDLFACHCLTDGLPAQGKASHLPFITDIVNENVQHVVDLEQS